MRSLFDMEGPVFGFFDRLSDIVILNLVFIICCIPVFTAGAALTALSTVTQRMARKEDGYIIKGFFRSFRQNFVQATVIWLILAAIAAVFTADMQILLKAGNSLPLSAAFVLLFITGIIFIFEFIYVFPVLARFDNSVINTMKNALLLAVRYLPWTFVLILMAFVPLAALYFYVQVAAPVFLIAGFSLISLGSSHIFKKLFDPLIKEEQ